MAWEGEDLKFEIVIESEGFDMDRDDYTLVIRKANKEGEVVIEKSNIVSDGNNHYLCVTKEQLSQFGRGDIYIVAYAEVQDSDFKDSMRSEIDKKLLCHIERV